MKVFTLTRAQMSEAREKSERLAAARLASQLAQRRDLIGLPLNQGQSASPAGLGIPLPQARLPVP